MSEIPLSSETELCERLMQINRAVAESADWKHTLDEILPLLRPALIFDNLAIYTISRADLANTQNPPLEAIYARAMGRGRSLEAEIAWGENLASQVFTRRSRIMETPPPNQEGERTQLPYLLGMPLMDKNNCLGVLTIIRFGGPVFTRKDERLAGFLVTQVVLLLQRQEMRRQVELLEVLRQQALLQDSFVSMISHELRHPIGFIKGYVTTLLRKEIEWDNKTQNEFLQIIDQETDQLLEIIDNMLDSARLQSGHLELEFQPVRLEALMEGAITQERNRHPGTAIHLHSSPGLPSISGDPRRLGQVFGNLINNAHKYAPGSDIWVTINTETQGLIIKVQDTGPGIPEKYLPHIFERFFRNPDQDPNIHGSGLGLYICKQIIEAHSGTITAESPPGQGVTIIVFLPYSQPT